MLNGFTVTKKSAYVEDDASSETFMYGDYGDHSKVPWGELLSFLANEITEQMSACVRYVTIIDLQAFVIWLLVMSDSFDVYRNINPIHSPTISKGAQRFTSVAWLHDLWSESGLILRYRG